MAPQLFDCTVPLKVFSFRTNTDYRRIPRVSDAPFQQSDSFPQSALFQSNNNAEHSPTAIIPKNSRAVPCLTFDFYTLTFQNLQYTLTVQTHEVILTNTTYIDLCKCLREELIITSLQIKKEVVSFAIAVPEFVLSQSQQFIESPGLSGNEACKPVSR